MRLRHPLTALTILALAALISSHASAAIVSIDDFYNTGVDANGNEITVLNTRDIHYSLNSVGGDGAYIKTSGWGADDANSQWIGWTPNFQGGGSASFYTQFTVDPVADLSTVLMSFTFGHDGSGSILLNNTQLFSRSGWSPSNNIIWDASSNTAFRNALVSGTNTLRFNITGDSLPNGMRITNASASFESVPAPAALALLALAGLALGARRSAVAS